MAERVHVAHVVVSDAFAGVERYLTYIAPALVARGIDVTIVGGDVDRIRAEVPGGVAVRPGSTLYEATRSLLAARPLDVVHVHMTSAEAVGALTKPLVRRPVVTTRHFAAVRGRKAVARLTRTIVERSIDRQIAISQFVADNVEGEFTVVLNAVPNRPMGPHSQRTVLVAQRLEREKATEVALAAWDASGLAGEGWELLIAGDGAERAALEAAAGPGVRFLGHRTDVPDLMADAAILLASAPDEPFGLSVAEAMSVGLPVVAASGGAHRETVGAVTPELLFPPENAAAAGALLAELAHDASRRARVGAALRAFQQERLSIDAHVTHLASIYDEVTTRARLR